MRETWVVNASPVISLAKIGRLDLLRSAEREVLIPTAVAEEILAGRAGDPASVALTEGSLGEPVSPRPAVRLFRRFNHGCGVGDGTAARPPEQGIARGLTPQVRSYQCQRQSDREDSAPGDPGRQRGPRLTRQGRVVVSTARILRGIAWDAADYFDARPAGAGAFNHCGWTKPPSPAESQTANRTHFFPVASNGIENFFAPKAPRSVAEMT